MQASLKAGKVTTLPNVNTIADGTAVKTPGEKIFPYIQKNLDDIITVDDDELVVAFLDMVENHKMVIENSGLLTVAALKHLNVKAKRVVSILSGGIGVITDVLCGSAGNCFPATDHLYRYLCCCRINRANCQGWQIPLQKSREMLLN